MEWKEEFNKITVDLGIVEHHIICTGEARERGELCGCEVAALDNNYRVFIEKTLANQNKELIQKCEEMKKHEAQIPIPQIRGDSYRMGYNKGCDDIINIIKDGNR